MRCPPGVAYPTGVPGAEWLIGAVLALAWCTGQILWVRAHDWQLFTMSSTWWISGLAGGLFIGWNVWRIRVLAKGELVWEPMRVPGHDRTVRGSWRLFTPAWRRGLALCRVTCVLDIDHLMILRLQSTAGLVLWVWCHRGHEPARWLDWRRAIHAGFPGSAGP